MTPNTVASIAEAGVMSQDGVPRTKNRTKTAIVTGITTTTSIWGVSMMNEDTKEWFFDWLKATGIAFLVMIPTVFLVGWGICALLGVNYW